MKNILLQKQEPIYANTKSLNQYLVEAETSDELQPSERYENSIVVFDDMLLKTQASIIDLFLTRGRHNIKNFY